VDITVHDNVTISASQSRSVLKEIGIPGEILHTPGHSDDSVSLLLDDGSVFTGDLTHPAFVDKSDADLVFASWHTLAVRGATRVDPPPRPGRPVDEELVA
jgi:glyoxylase-like metal-dependent hydrolase (beta-lactamase superfamily II)